MLSLERVFKVLESFGFSRREAIVYTYLSKAGPQRSKDLIHELRMPRKQLYSELKKLHKKGVVTRNSAHPILFSAISFEELLNQYIMAIVEEAKILKETQKELLVGWRSVTNDHNN